MYLRIPTLLAALVLVSGVAQADYVAYSVGERDRSPLPARLDSVDTKYLVNIEWGEYDGRRARVGVLEVDNTSSTSSFRVSTTGGDVDYSSSTTGVPVNGIESIVIDAMARTNRFQHAIKLALAFGGHFVSTVIRRWNDVDTGYAYPDELEPIRRAA